MFFIRGGQKKPKKFGPPSKKKKNFKKNLKKNKTKSPLKIRMFAKNRTLIEGLEKKI